MTKNNDFKRLVRARMLKTGESYMAARAQLQAPPDGPTEDEFADLAGMTDEAVQKKTGRTWPEWVKALDGIGAETMDHKTIAATLRDTWPEVGPWWTQSVTVGYERIRGLRQKGQLCTGDFAASKSKTFPVPLPHLFRVFQEHRDQWIGTPTTVRTETVDRSVRLQLEDGTVASAWFTDKGAKSMVAIQHDKLDSEARRSLEKQNWAERLKRLGDLL